MAYSLRRGKNIVGEYCEGVEERDGEFYIKFKVRESDTSRIAEKLKEIAEDDGNTRHYGSASELFYLGEIHVSKDPRNGGSLHLSEYYKVPEGNDYAEED